MYAGRETFSFEYEIKFRSLDPIANKLLDVGTKMNYLTGDLNGGKTYQ